MHLRRRRNLWCLEELHQAAGESLRIGMIVCKSRMAVSRRYSRTVNLDHELVEVG